MPNGTVLREQVAIRNGVAAIGFGVDSEDFSVVVFCVRRGALRIPRSTVFSLVDRGITLRVIERVGVVARSDV